MKCCALSFFFVKHLIAVSWRSLIWLVKVLCLGREVEKWRKQKEEGSGRVSAHRDTKTQPQSRAFVWKTGSVCELWCNIYRHHPPCSLTSGQRLNFTYHTTSAGVAKISGRFFFLFLFPCCLLRMKKWRLEWQCLCSWPRKSSWCKCTFIFDFIVHLHLLRLQYVLCWLFTYRCIECCIWESQGPNIYGVSIFLEVFIAENTAQDILCWLYGIKFIFIYLFSPNIENTMHPLCNQFKRQMKLMPKPC